MTKPQSPSCIGGEGRLRRKGVGGWVGGWGSRGATPPPPPPPPPQPGVMLSCEKEPCPQAQGQTAQHKDVILKNWQFTVGDCVGTEGPPSHARKLCLRTKMRLIGGQLQVHKPVFWPVPPAPGPPPATPHFSMGAFNSKRGGGVPQVPQVPQISHACYCLPRPLENNELHRVRCALISASHGHCIRCLPIDARASRAAP